MSMQRNATVTRPSVRTDKLVMTETADEVLLYDTEKHHIHHLNATTAAVWRLCDGQHTVGDLARGAGQALGATVDEATVRLALTKLDEAGLLQAALAAELRVSRMSRRTFMQRAGAAAAVPIIVSTTAPTASAANSSLECGENCAQRNDDCNRGGCSQCGAGSGSGFGEFCCTPATFDPCKPATWKAWMCATIPWWDGAGMPGPGSPTCQEAARVESIQAAAVEETTIEQQVDEQAEADRIAAAQAEADRIAAEQAAAQAEADRIAAEQAEADRIAAEQAAAQAEADRIAAEQAEADRIAAEQAEADRIAAEQAAAQAEADRIAAEQAAAQAEADRIAAEQAAVEQPAAEQPAGDTTEGDGT